MDNELEDSGSGINEVIELRRRVTELEKAMLERQRAEEAAASQAKTIEAFFKHTLTPLVLLDKDYNFIRVNEAYARACQRNASEFPGHNYFEFYPSDAKQIFDDVVRTKEPVQVAARPFSFPDHPEGGVTYWDWKLTPLLDSKGEVELLLTIVSPRQTRQFDNKMSP